MKDTFTFKQFNINQDRCAMKVGTDGVLLGCWAEGGKQILDVGTGTGLIALIMAQRFADATIDAIDIDRDACIQAEENKSNSKFTSRISIFNTDLQSFHPDTRYDAMVCNPPFFIHSLKSPDHKRNMARHTDTLSPRDLFKHAYRLLTEEGVLSLIIPTEQAEEFIAESFIVGFFTRAKLKIRTTANKPAKRILLSFGKKQEDCYIDMEETLFDNQEKTYWYQELTREFYL